MSRKRNNTNLYCDTFICQNCGRTVDLAQCGSRQRNHCPYCLWSMHIDIQIGDRRSNCKGNMEPIAVWVKPGNEWSILHRCTKCGFIRANRVSSDDNETRLFVLAAKALTQMPFPAEAMMNQLLMTQESL